MATKLEAAPFIEGLKLKFIEEKPFSIYQGDDLFLSVSGIGKTKSAVATSYMINIYKTRNMFNIGAAGAVRSGFDIGNIFHINKVIEYDRPVYGDSNPRFIKPDIIKGLTTASLSTQDRPVIDDEDRNMIASYADLVDMEGAAFLHTCRLLSCSAYLFKVVSDIPGHADVSEILKNIKLTGVKMYKYFVDEIYGK